MAVHVKIDMMESSNTGGNRPSNKGQFTKGDPRINRKGRPKSFDALRELAQQIAHEVARAGDKPIVIGNHKVTVTEAILRSWASSKNPQLQRAFFEIAFGRPPINLGLDHSGELKIVVEYADPEDEAP